MRSRFSSRTVSARRAIEPAHETELPIALACSAAPPCAPAAPRPTSQKKHSESLLEPALRSAGSTADGASDRPKTEETEPTLAGIDAVLGGAAFGDVSDVQGASIDGHLHPPPGVPS